MSDAIPVHCRHCEEPLDVYQPHEDRFCSEDCKTDYENANERAYDRQQERLMEGGGGPALREQQIAAMRLK
jgi:predicted nucleic acid-binding Zn ribbon protein